MKWVKFIIIFVLSGCTTQLWKAHYENESINGFYVNPERLELIVSTKANGYIFKSDKSLIGALGLGERITFKPNFFNFVIDEKNKITGQLTLTAETKRISSNEAKELVDMGFSQYPHSNKLVFKKQLSGLRYELHGEIPLKKLENSIQIRIERPDTFTEKAQKIIATPAAIIFDTVIVLPPALLVVSIMAFDSYGTTSKSNAVPKEPNVPLVSQPK